MESTDYRSQLSSGDTRINFAGGIVHAVFFRISVAFAEPTTILPVYIMLLTGSKTHVGLLTSVLLAGEVLPTLLFSRLLEPRRRKLPALLVAVFSRAGSWLAIGLLTWYLGNADPGIIELILFVLIGVFALGGSLGGVALMDVVGKVIPDNRRGLFLGTRQLLGSLAALGAGLFVGRILAHENLVFPSNYAVLFLASAAALTVAGVGFAIMREPAVPGTMRSEPLGQYLRNSLAILRDDNRLKRYLLIRNLVGLHRMIVPFYVLYAREILGASDAAVGSYVFLQILGGSLSNVAWARINDYLGSDRLLQSCTALCTAIPVLALALGNLSPGFYGAVFLLLGATINGREMAFTSYLLDIAPPNRRPTYAGLGSTLTAPTLFFPLVGGIVLDWLGYGPVFVGVAAAVGITAVLASGLELSRPSPTNDP